MLEMTVRRPVPPLVFRRERQRTQRRKIKFRRVLLAVARMVSGGDTAEIARVAPAINPGIAVQHFAPFARARQADAQIKR